MNENVVLGIDHGAWERKIAPDYKAGDKMMKKMADKYYDQAVIEFKKGMINFHPLLEKITSLGFPVIDILYGVSTNRNIVNVGCSTIVEKSKFASPDTFRTFAPESLGIFSTMMENVHIESTHCNVTTIEGPNGKRALGCNNWYSEWSIMYTDTFTSMTHGHVILRSTYYFPTKQWMFEVGPYLLNRRNEY